MIDKSRCAISSDYTLTRSGDSIELMIKGCLTESSEVLQLDLSAEKSIVFNFKESTYLTSGGILAWIKLTSKIPQTCEVSVIHLPPMVVQQMNMIDMFLPRQTKVLSLDVPYTCLDHDHEFRVTLDLNKDFRFATPNAPASYNIKNRINCPDGVGLAEPDLIESVYFRFLSHSRS